MLERFSPEGGDVSRDRYETEKTSRINPTNIGTGQECTLRIVLVPGPNQSYAADVSVDVELIEYDSRMWWIDFNMPRVPEPVTTWFTMDGIMLDKDGAEVGYVVGAGTDPDSLTADTDTNRAYIKDHAPALA